MRTIWVVFASRFALTLAVSLIFAVNVSSSTVHRVGTAQLLSQSELIFEGSVQDRWSGMAQDNIVTFVRFEVTEVIKGEHREPSLTLRFMGGEYEGIRQTVTGMNIPEGGERGIYFVESVNRQLVNPLYGWTQGHFLLRDDPSGQTLVYTQRGELVRDLQETISPDGLEFTHEHAHGVVVSAQALRPDSMTVSEFKSKLAQMLENLE
jgi:hypothetical protein